MKVLKSDYMYSLAVEDSRLSPLLLYKPSFPRRGISMQWAFLILVLGFVSLSPIVCRLCFVLSWEIPTRSYVVECLFPVVLMCSFKEEQCIWKKMLYVISSVLLGFDHAKWELMYCWNKIKWPCVYTSPHLFLCLTLEERGGRWQAD